VVRRSGAAASLRRHGAVLSHQASLGWEAGVGGADEVRSFSRSATAVVAGSRTRPTNPHGAHFSAATWVARVVLVHLIQTRQRV